MTTLEPFPFYLRIVTATAHLALTAADMCDVGRLWSARAGGEVCPKSRGDGYANCGREKDWHAVVVGSGAIDACPARARHSRFRTQVRSSVFCLSRSMAHAQQLRPNLQRQRLSVRQRPRCSDLSAAGVLARHVSRDAAVAQGEQQPPGCRFGSREWEQRAGGVYSDFVGFRSWGS